MNHKQKDRQQRGEDFQVEIRRSWRLIPNCWRLRITDSGATRPGDELIILPHVNILAEHKRTVKPEFNLGLLRVNQVQGLLDFDRVTERNIGLVFLSVLTDEVDETYAIRLTIALRYMVRHGGRAHISLQELQDVACQLPLLDKEERTYDLRGLVANCEQL